MGGKSGGSGGGNSGKVDYPAYMKTWHTAGLGSWGTMPSVAVSMNAAIGASPYAAATPYNPGTEVDAMIIAATNQLTKVDALSFVPMDSHLAKIDAMDTIGEVVDFEAIVYPRFERGMQNINAVQSAAFVQGKTLLEANYAAKLAGVKMELRSQHVGKDMDLKMQHLQIRRDAAALVVEANRMSIVAYGEERGLDIEYSEKDALWDLEVYKYGGNFLGSIGGTAVNQGTDGSSKGQSGLGGALSGAAAGAAMGAQVGGPYGAAIGGAVGLIGGLL